MAKEKQDLTGEQLTAELNKRQQADINKYIKELGALSDKHNLQIAQAACPNCQGKGVVLQVVAKQSNNGK